MKRVFTIFFGAVLIFVCFSAFSACGEDPEYDVYVNFYCYYDEVRTYDQVPLSDKYVCTFRAEKDENAQGTLKYREKGYYYFTYEVFYSTGVPYEINSEEKEAQTMRAVPDEIHPEKNTKSVYKEIQIMGSRGALLRKFNLEIEFVW